MYYPKKYYLSLTKVSPPKYKNLTKGKKTMASACSVLTIAIALGTALKEACSD